VDKLGVVILTHGLAGVFRPLLDSLLDQGVDPNQIVLVHNPPASGEALPELGVPGVEVLEMDRNRGYAGGMNAGVRRHLDLGERGLFLS